MAASGMKLKERAQGMAAVAAAPSITLGLAGDLFTPVGGWIAVGIVGVLALVLAVYLLVNLTLKRDLFFNTFIGRITTDSDDWRWIWNPYRPLSSHGLHMTIVFGVICLFIAGKSFAARTEGGLVAAKVPAVSVAQQQLGLTAKLVEEARKTNRTLDSIDFKADNFKRENSDDPRKELVNSGVLWESIRLERAISEGDTRTVQLFLLGGMPVSGTAAAAAFEQSAPIANLLSEHAALFDEKKCDDFFQKINMKAVLTAGAHNAKLVTVLCGNDFGRRYASKELAATQAALAKRLDYRRKEKAARKPVAQCIRDNQNDGNLTSRAMEVNAGRAIFGTLSDYEYMLIKIQNALITGRSDFQKEIQEYCQKQAKENESNDDYYEKNMLMWEKISDWVN
jgi:hypothetical protein